MSKTDGNNGKNKFELENTTHHPYFSEGRGIPNTHGCVLKSQTLNQILEAYIRFKLSKKLNANWNQVQSVHQLQLSGLLKDH